MLAEPKVPFAKPVYYREKNVSNRRLNILFLLSLSLARCTTTYADPSMRGALFDTDVLRIPAAYHGLWARPLDACGVTRDYGMQVQIGETSVGAMQLRRVMTYSDDAAIMIDLVSDESVITTPNIDYIASLILAEGWDALNVSVGGNLVVAIPSDDVIIITSAVKESARADLRAYVKNAYDNANRSVSSSLYIRKNGKWVEDDTF